MRSILCCGIFSALFLFTINAHSQLFYALEVEFDFPTPSLSDGKVIPKLIGNYPNQVEYKIHIVETGLSYTVDDSLTDLPEISFSSLIYVYAVDVLTGDSLARCSGMLLNQDVSILWNSFTPPTSGFSCDGSFNGDVSVPFVTQQVGWCPTVLCVDDVMLPAIENLDLDNMCAGFYTLSIPASGAILQTSLYFQPLTSSTGAINVEVFTTFSSPSNCTATATATVSGGTPPYQYFWNLDSGTLLADSLCPGLHSLKVVDAFSDSTMILFGVADSNYFFEDTLSLGTPEDTIYFMTEDCGIDYGAPIDSIAITFADFYNDSTVAMGFTIWQDDTTYYVLDTAFYGPPSYGLFLIDLTLFCLNKALGGEVIKFRGIYEKYLSINETESDAILIYPNPASTIIYIDGDGVAEVVISNLEGKKMLVTNQMQVDIAQYPAGVYQIAFFDVEGNYLDTRKLVVSK